MANFKKLKAALDAKLWDDIDNDPDINKVVAKLHTLYARKKHNVFDEELNKDINNAENELRIYKKKYTARGLAIQNATTLDDLNLTEEKANALIAWFEENFVQEDDDLEP